MIVTVLQYAAGIVLVAGALLCLLSAVGILRLPDLYTRMHAASKAGALGTGLMFAAIGVSSFELPILLRALMGFVFVVLTTPISAHVLARAAYQTGQVPVSGTAIDDEAQPQINSN